jgi:protein O-GlcNAc transferase
MTRVLVSFAALVFSLTSLGARGLPLTEAQILSRGATLEERGDLAQARDVYLAGLQQLPKSGELALRLGLLALRAGDWAEAVRLLEQARTARPRHVDTLYYLAQAYYLDGRQAAASATIERAATLAPTRADVAQKHGEYLCELKACQEGLRFLQKAQRLDPELPNIDFDLGMAHHKLASLTEARQSLEAALKKDPENLLAARFLADVLHRATEWSRAQELYEYVLARDPRNPWACYGLGHALLALNRPAEALAPLKRSLELDPTIAKAHYQLGRALRLLGRPDEARAEWELFRALRERQKEAAPPLRPERPSFEDRIWRECARLVAEGQESDALAYLDSVLEGSGQDPHYLLGVLYFNLDRGADATRLLTQAVSLAPEDAEAQAALGRALVLAGENERAEEALGGAAALKPDGELTLVGQGELAYARRRWSEAIQAFERSGTAQAPVLLKLCRAYFEAGNDAKARETAQVVRAFAKGDGARLRELETLLASHPAQAPAATPALDEVGTSP